MTAADTTLDVRRRRATFRANHRGTKEMDWMLGKYADVYLPGMDEAALTEFEQFLAISDPELQTWLLDGRPVVSEFAPLIERIRSFHGLETEQAG